MESNEYVQELLEKYLEGKASSQEQSIIETWYLSHSERNIGEALPDRLAEEDRIEIKRKLMEYAANSSTTHQGGVSLWRIAVRFAAAFMFVGFGWWFFQDDNQGVQLTEQNAYLNDVKPGEESAMLTLASGKTIKLNAMNNGVLTEELGVIITESAGGEVIYHINENVEGASSKRHTLKTSKGETYKMRLPDGTNVWLNAASSLTFPVSFQNSDQRKVELNGEAYFEVAENKEKPFIVASNNQSIEVLGTRFNINSYQDEPWAKTTLMEGSIKVIASSSQFSGQELTLIPNQQAIVGEEDIKVVAVNADEFNAWTRGLFKFNDEELESILLKLSRWYNVDVTFQDESLKKEVFWGIVTKHDNLSKVLRMLEKTNVVRFEIQGSQVFVKRYMNL